MATTKITSNVLAPSAAQTNINNDGSFTLSVPTQINNTLTTNSSVSISGNLTVDGDISSKGAVIAGSAMSMRSTSSQQYVARFVGQNSSFAGFAVTSTNSASKPFIQFGAGSETAANFTLLQDSTSALSFRGGNALGGALLTLNSNTSVGINNATPNAAALLDLTSTTKGFLPPRMENTSGVSSPVAGLIVYNSTDNKISLHNGTAWGDVLTSHAGSFTSDTLRNAVSQDTGTGNLVFSTNPTLEGANIAGNLTVDTNTLFVDSVNNRVGIGTNNPLQAIDFRPISFNASQSGGIRFDNTSGTWPCGIYIRSDGSGNPRLSLDAPYQTNSLNLYDNKIGIGTLTPNERLQVTNGNIGTFGNGNGFVMYNLGQGNYSGNYEMARFMPVSNEFLFQTLQGGTGVGRNLRFNVGNADITLVNSSGNIGIGTTSPSAKLHTISTTEQVRFGYDTNNYWNATTNSVGITTLSAVGSNAKFVFSNNVEVTAEGGVAGSTIKIGGSGMTLGFAAGGSSYSGIWCNNATPDFSNYTFLGDGNDSFFNAKATGKNYFRTGNVTRMMVDQNGVFIPGVGTNANPTTQQLTVIPSAASKIGAVIKGFTSQTANLIEWQDSAGVVLASVTASGNISTTGHFSAATKSFKIPHQSKGGHLQYGVVESDCHSVLVRGKISSDTITLPEHWSWLVDADSVTVQLTPVGCYQQLYIVSSDNQTVKVGGVTGEYCYVVYGTRKDVAPLEVEIE